MRINRELIQTEDGSSTLFDSRTGDTFHSIHGAIRESRLIYLQYGFLSYCNELPKEYTSNINILEMGFGTGLNLLLTCEASSSFPTLSFNYHSYELYPIAEEDWMKLTFLPFRKEEIAAIHQSDWDKEYSAKVNFQYRKILKDFTTATLPERFYHVVYYDAFGPTMEPSLWRDDLLQRVCKSIAPGGVFVTYSTRGVVCRSLEKAGLRVEKLPGPKGKREVTRAITLP